MPQAQDPRNYRKKNTNRAAAARPSGQQPRRPKNGQPARRPQQGQQARYQGQQPRRGAQQGQRRPEQRQVRPAPQKQQPKKQRQYDENAIDIATTIKGVIAVFLTLLVVVIIIMLFAKSLFVSDETIARNVKTGHLTETEYVPIEIQTTRNEEVVTTKKPKKKTEKAEEEPPALPEGLDTLIAGTYTVNDAVYLHPEPNTNSENLMVLPYGADVKVYGSTNGWYYVDFEGQVGYAWGSYFNPKE